MLTGDKQSTALAVAAAAGLRTHGSDVRVLTADIGGVGIKSDRGGTVVVQGGVLSRIVGERGDTDCINRLLPLLLGAECVIACRLSPSQKAWLVKLVQSSRVRRSLSVMSQGPRVLAVGDGGNDVPMIMAADVGVGVVGREGSEVDFYLLLYRFASHLLFSGCS